MSYSQDATGKRHAGQVQAAQDELMYLKQRAGDNALEHVKQLEVRQSKMSREVRFP